jgi:hypothetical protein
MRLRYRGSPGVPPVSFRMMMAAYTTFRVRRAMRRTLGSWSAMHSLGGRGSVAHRDAARTVSRRSGAETRTTTRTARDRMEHHARADLARTLTLRQHRRPEQAHHRRAARPHEELAHLGRGQRRLNLRMIPRDEGLLQHGLQRVRRICLMTWPANERLCNPETAPTPLGRTRPAPRR